MVSLADFPVTLEALLGASSAVVATHWWAFRSGKTSMADHVKLTEKAKELEKQHSVRLNEELATCKQTIMSRDDKIFMLETQLVKFEADLKILGAAPGNSEIHNHLLLLEDLKSRIANFDELRDALLGPEEELWKLRGAMPSPAQVKALRESRVKVIIVGNLKGGVGKTTVTANLAAYFALKRHLRVLVIDLDYQGSLTGTLLNAAKSALGANILADALLGGEMKGRWLAEVPRDLGRILPQTRLVTCGQLFDRFENQTMLRWLIGDIGDDIRYRLAKLILTPEVQAAYDVVLIDAPPRTSLGTINALCASHALLIPTVLDSLSVDAVGRFLRRVSELRSLAPGLVTVSVVPSLTQGTKLRPDEEDARSEVSLALTNWSGTAGITKAFIRHFPTLSKIAGRDVGYISDRRYARPAFDALGAEVSAQVGL